MVEKFTQDNQRSLNLEPEELRDGLELASTQIFVFEDVLYQQTEGLGIGNPLSPLYADLIMIKIENQFLHVFRTSIAWYRRFMDDTFELWMGTNKKLQEFIQYINQIHPKIKFTVEQEDCNHSLSFLDLSIKRTPNHHFKTSIYRKPMAVMKPLHYESAHHPAQKWGTLTSAVLKARKLCSEQEDLWTELSFLRKAFLHQGYPLLRLHQTINKALQKSLWKGLQPAQTPVKKPHVVTNYKSIPYIPSLTKEICKEWKKLELGFKDSPQFLKWGFKSDTNILSMLSYRAESTDILNRSGVVYGVSCEECDGASTIRYVGETSRTLRERLYSHKHDKANKSALRNHTETHPGHVNFKYKILASDYRASQRKILESIQIKKLCPIWNLDKGNRLYVTKIL